MSTLVKCVNGHYYDADKSRTCPYCRSIDEERKRISVMLSDHPVYAGIDSGIGDDVTQAMPAAGADSAFLGGGGPVRDAGPGVDDDGVTVGFFSKARGTAYITGWLVGTEGPVKGRDYRIYHGISWAGRSYNSDIIIHEDGRIADFKQCGLVYDGRGNRFYILPGQGTTTYLNGEVLEKPMPLKLGDLIGMGNSKFEFVPYCREGHTWEIEEGAGE